MGGTHRALSYEILRCAQNDNTDLTMVLSFSLLFTPYPPSFASDVMKADIAIITIREDEFKAVRERFQTKRQRMPGGRTCLMGEMTREILRCAQNDNTERSE